MSDTERLLDRLVHAVDEACLKAYIDGARGATLEVGCAERLDATRAFWDAKDEVRSTVEALRQACADG